MAGHRTCRCHIVTLEAPVPVLGDTLLCPASLDQQQQRPSGSLSLSQVTSPILSGFMTAMLLLRLISLICCCCIKWKHITHSILHTCICINSSLTTGFSEIRGVAMVVYNPVWEYTLLIKYSYHCFGHVQQKNDGHVH